MVGLSQPSLGNVTNLFGRSQNTSLPPYRVGDHSLMLHEIRCILAKEILILQHLSHLLRSLGKRLGQREHVHGSRGDYLVSLPQLRRL